MLKPPMMENSDIIVSMGWLAHPHGISTIKSQAPISEIVCCKYEDIIVSFQMYR